MKFIATIVGLVIANYIYQYAGQQNWAVALDRSTFQAVAVLCCWCSSVRS